MPDLLVILIGLAIIGLIVLLTLPPELSNRISNALLAVAALITAYQIITTANEYKSKMIKDAVSANEATFLEIQKRFGDKSSLDKFYKEIYGRNFNREELSMVNIMAQKMEDANNLYNLSEIVQNIPDDGTIRLFKTWVKSPTFRTIWPSIKQYYDSGVNKLIDFLQKH